jgi:hypothetical protein
VKGDKKLEQLEQWTSTIASKFPNLSKPQATVLALWSFGMALAKSCGMTSVVAILAPLLSIGKDKKSVQRKKNSLRQRLRQWCYDAKDKNGSKRRQLDVQTCFPFLMKWLISQWQGKQIALTLEATTLSVRFTVLVVSVLYRGSAIPVAWTVLKGNTKGAWNTQWLRMLRLLAPGIPDDMTVIVLTDRGLYSTRLFRCIRRLGWHPFMRRSVLGKFRPACGHYFWDISHFAKKPGTFWAGYGTLFKTKSKQVNCVLLAYWGESHREPWFIVTDMQTQDTNACWHGMRAWIEQCFRTIKRGGWQWHRTRMRDPERASRLWLAISVATLWLVSVGGEADEAISQVEIPDITGHLRSRRATRLRMTSVFRQGWIAIFVSLVYHFPLPLGRFIPEPWLQIPETSHQPEPNTGLAKCA